MAAETSALEREILGAVLLRGERFADVARTLTREHFRGHAHQLVWHAIEKLAAAGEPIDAISVSQWLIDRNRGVEIDHGAMVTGLAAECVGTDPMHHVKRLHQTHLAQAARRIGAALHESSGSQDDIAQAISELLALEQGSLSHEYHISEALALAHEDMARAEAAKDGLRGITTGFTKLNEHLGGFQDSDLIIVGARPAMGKTSLLLNFATGAGGAGHALGLVSAEQPAMQVAQRHLAAVGQVPLHDLRMGRIKDDYVRPLTIAQQKLKGMRYWMFDRSGVSIDDVIRVARAWRNKHGIQALYLDYLQRIKAPGEGRVAQVGLVARELKTLARELNIPVVALAQVNRNVELRPNKRPGVADLKDSGEIEQEADQILLIYRDEVYNENSPDKGIAEIMIGKNRHGYVGTCRVAWQGQYVRFKDLAPQYGEVD